MSCRSCEDRPLVDAHTPTDLSLVWGVERLGGLRCSRCGALLDAEDIVRLLLEKQSQLERFGLLKPASIAPRSHARTLRLVRLETD